MRKRPFQQLQNTDFIRSFNEKLSFQVTGDQRMSPTIVHPPTTEVRLWGKKCYIVRLHQQCVTFKDCNRKRYVFI